MRKILAAALGAALFVAAKADDKSKTGGDGACNAPGCESTAPAPGAKAKKAGKARVRAAKPEAVPPAPKNQDRQEKPKPCEELRPCPIE